MTNNLRVKVDDIYERVKIRGYIHAQVWNPDGSQMAVIYGTEVAIILDPLSRMSCRLGGVVIVRWS